MMIDIILQIMILTAFLTLCGGAMLIFRCFCVKGGGRVLKRMWIIVLLLAFIPMYLLPITLPNRLRQQMVPTDCTVPAEPPHYGQFTAVCGPLTTYHRLKLTPPIS